MEICVCVKRVPMVGGAIKVTSDGQDIDTTMSGFTVSPHEECAVEEAVQITERLGGTVTVLTLGPPEAADQLRDMLALGAGKAILLVTDGSEWGPVATASAIADTLRDARYDLLLFGNESADSGGYQVPVRVAHALGLPCVTGIKKLRIGQAGDSAAAVPPGNQAGGSAAVAPAGNTPQAARSGRITASRDYRGLQESFDLPLPAVVSVKEGINLPRYPSLPGRLRAKRAVIEQRAPHRAADGLRKLRLQVPPSAAKQAEVLGTGPDAIPALVDVLDSLGVLP